MKYVGIEKKMLANTGYTPLDVCGLFFTLDSNNLSEYHSQQSNEGKNEKRDDFSR